MEEEEIWKGVVGFEELFMVSSFGSIWSRRSNRLLKCRKNNEGYIVISTKIGGRKGKAICWKVHRLVADAFLDSPSKELIEECSKTKYGVVPVNHKNGDKTDNYWDNLEWSSYSDNSKHAVETGLSEYKQGLDHHRSVLNEEIVSKIRKEYVPYSKTHGLRALCKKYNLKHNTVSVALRR